MKQSTIYQISVISKQVVSTIRPSEPVVTYYSNLKRAVEAIQTTLLVNGWEAKRANYSAVYRTLNERGKYVEDFGVSGVKFFQLTVRRLLLNPSLTNLGIEISPVKENGNNT